MPNVKVQSSNEIQSSNDKISKKRNFLALSHFDIHLAFGF
jgi:hypothetical protein